MSAAGPTTSRKLGPVRATTAAAVLVASLGLAGVGVGAMFFATWTGRVVVQQPPALPTIADEVRYHELLSEYQDAAPGEESDRLAHELRELTWQAPLPPRNALPDEDGGLWRAVALAGGAVAILASAVAMVTTLLVAAAGLYDDDGPSAPARRGGGAGVLRSARIQLVRGFDRRRIGLAACAGAVFALGAVGVLGMSLVPPTLTPADLAELSTRAGALADESDQIREELRLARSKGDERAEQAQKDWLALALAELGVLERKLHPAAFPVRTLGWVGGVLTLVGAIGFATMIAVADLLWGASVIEVHRAGIRVGRERIDLADVDRVELTGRRIAVVRLGAAPVLTPPLVAPERVLARVRQAMAQQGPAADERAHREVALRQLAGVRDAAG